MKGEMYNMSIIDEYRTMWLRGLVSDADRDILDYCESEKNKRVFSDQAKKELGYRCPRQYGYPFKNFIGQIPNITEFDPFVSGQRLFILRPPKFVYSLFGKEICDRLILTNLESVGIENAFRQFIGLRYPPIRTCTDISDMKISINSENHNSWTWNKGPKPTEEEIYKNKVWK